MKLISYHSNNSCFSIHTLISLRPSLNIDVITDLIVVMGQNRKIMGRQSTDQIRQWRRDWKKKGRSVEFKPVGPGFTVRED